MSPKDAQSAVACFKKLITSHINGFGNVTGPGERVLAREVVETEMLLAAW
jgi:hypothetical protein